MNDINSRGRLKRIEESLKAYIDNCCAPERLKESMG